MNTAQIHAWPNYSFYQIVIVYSKTHKHITDNPKEKLDNFLAKMEMDLLVGHDEDKKGFDNYQVTGRTQMYIINREGIIVYEGNKVNEEMIEEVIATNTVTLSKKKEYAKVITRGGFTAGEDPGHNRFKPNPLAKLRPIFESLY